MLWVMDTCKQLPVGMSVSKPRRDELAGRREAETGTTQPRNPTSRDKGHVRCEQEWKPREAAERPQTKQPCKQPQCLHLLTSFFLVTSNIKQGLLAEAQWRTYWKDTLLHFLETKQEANNQRSIREKEGEPWDRGQPEEEGARVWARGPPGDTPPHQALQVQVREPTVTSLGPTSSPTSITAAPRS